MTRVSQARTEHPLNGDGKAATPSPDVVRICSEELFGTQREIEIEHHGRIYRLRVTQLDKLILTA